MVRLAVTAVLAFAVTAMAGVADLRGSAIAELIPRQETLESVPSPAPDGDSMLSPKSQQLIKEFESTFTPQQNELKDKSIEAKKALDQINSELEDTFDTQKKVVETIDKSISEDFDNQFRNGSSPAGKGE